jgi:hypothetical protein
MLFVDALLLSLASLMPHRPRSWTMRIPTDAPP